MKFAKHSNSAMQRSSCLEFDLIYLILDPSDFDLGEEWRPVVGEDVLVPILLHVLPDGANVSR